MKDLLESITGSHSEETSWGVVPRFKHNPDTGTGSGIKIKGSNVLGSPVTVDFMNIFTSRLYQSHEMTAIIPRAGKQDNYWYRMVTGEFYIIPDLRFDTGLFFDCGRIIDDSRDYYRGSVNDLKYASGFGRSGDRPLLVSWACWILDSVMRTSGSYILILERFSNCIILTCLTLKFFIFHKILTNNYI